jgi:SAM-dependent methyltransferase
MSATPSKQSTYDAYYFRHGCGRPYERSAEWLGFFDQVADTIVRQIQPRTVLDAGCAMGFLVEAFRKRGLEAWGLDLSEYAIQRVDPTIQPFCTVGNITTPLSRTYDLIVCIEVLEHLPAAEAEQAVQNLCQATGEVLFSSTPTDYKEATHFNVQPVEYWAELFAQRGFFRDVDFDASFIAPWAIRFRHHSEPVHRVVREYERRFWLLWRENIDLRSFSGEMRDQLATQERQVQELAARANDKESVVQELQTMGSGFEQKERQVQVLNAQLAEKDQEARQLRAQIQEIYESRSWRTTKPLRWISERLFPR